MKNYSCISFLGFKTLSKVDAVQENQARLEKSIKELGGAYRGSEKRTLCSFCESDVHSFRQCTEKRPYVICGQNNHTVQRCLFDLELSCRVSQEVGHAALLHEAEDQDFRMEIGRVQKAGVSSHGRGRLIATNQIGSPKGLSWGGWKW